MPLKGLRAVVDLTAVTTALTAAQTKADAAMRKADAATTTAVAAATSAAATATDITTLAQLAGTVTSLSDASTLDRAALHRTVDALAARGITGQVKQFTTTLSVLLNGTGTVTVTWDTPFATTTYLPLLITPVKISAITVTDQTKTGVTFTYKAGLAVTIGALFHVVGLAPTPLP